MRGEDLTKIREHLGLTKAELAGILNENLDRKYRPERVGEWEKTQPPAHVATFVENLALSSATPLPSLDELAEIGPDAPSPGGDTPPPEPERDTPAETTLSFPTGGGIYARVCTDLWATIALMVTSAGAITGNAALADDGRIIDGDKEKLGAAWGKLAETNETFRRMLMSATTGGAWLEITLVTGVTANKMLANHRKFALADKARAQAAQQLRVVEGDAATGRTAS